MGNRGSLLVQYLTFFILAFAVLQIVLLSSWLPNPPPEANGRSSSAPVQPSQIGHGRINNDSGVTNKSIPSNKSDDHGQKTHKIPYTLIFTHYKNLLEDDPSTFDEEERVLAANIRHSVRVHQPTLNKFIFLTDDGCIQSLHRVYPSLVPYFKNESMGMYKADICRGSALYENGGIYLDVDVGVRHDLWRDLLPSTEFVTSRVHRASKYPKHFFQAIMGAAPRSTILYRYLRLFEKYYLGSETVKGPLGVILLKRAWDDVYDRTTHQPPTELYQEILYNRQLFPHLHPAPTWGGTKRACHFVVVATANHRENIEWTAPPTNISLQFPLYSRIGGSRMCPMNSMSTNTLGGANSTVLVVQ
jgi:hypothetical protein